MPRGSKPGERRGGRAKGTPNKATGEIRERARAIIESPTYREMLKKRVQENTLAPAIEALLYHYAYGKPSDTLRVQGELPPFRLIVGDDEPEEGEGG